MSVTPERSLTSSPAQFSVFLEQQKYGLSTRLREVNLFMQTDKRHYRRPCIYQERVKVSMRAFDGTVFRDYWTYTKSTIFYILIPSTDILQIAWMQLHAFSTWTEYFPSYGSPKVILDEFAQKNLRMEDIFRKVFKNLSSIQDGAFYVSSFRLLSY